jgi:hypothetical protein
MEGKNMKDVQNRLGMSKRKWRHDAETLRKKATNLRQSKAISDGLLLNIQKPIEQAEINDKYDQ